MRQPGKWLKVVSFKWWGRKECEGFQSDEQEGHEGWRGSDGQGSILIASRIHHGALHPRGGKSRG